MGVLLLVDDEMVGRTSHNTSAPKKKWIQHYMQGEDPSGLQAEQTLPEEIGRVGQTKLEVGQTISSALLLSNGGERREDYSSLEQSHVASVIQRLGGPSSTNGSSLRHTAASFYSYQQDPRSRSPSPARVNGDTHYNGALAAAAAAASQHHRSAPSPPPHHSHSLYQHHQPHLSVLSANGSSYSAALVHQRSYQSSPKMMIDAESCSSYSQQLPQLHSGGHGSLTSTAAATSSSSSSSSTSSSSNSRIDRDHHSSSSTLYHRVDDLASRSHRLEEALLRASRKSPPMPASTSSFQQSQNAGSGGGGGGNHSSGRTSADELLELKKRSGAGTREVHNKLEKNRRAHLRECFEFLRKQLPAIDDKKLSNLGILKSALRFIQTLKRKEREYEHTMERLAREKIASQQRLAALRKEISSIPGYSGDVVPIDSGNVSLPVVLHSQHVQQQQQMIHERDSPLTFANVQAHTLRESENHHHYHLQPPSTGGGGGNRQNHRDCDQESNSGTSTASERGDVSDHDEPSTQFTQTFSSQSQQHVVVRPVAQPHQQQQLVVNGSTSIGRTLKRPLELDDDGRIILPTIATHEGGDVVLDNSRPHIKYVRASFTNPTTSTVTTLANVAASQPTAYLTMVPATTGGVIELASVPLESGGAGGGSYHVRHPSTIAFATSATGHHVQLAAGSQVLATHHGVQLLTTHGSPTLKVLTAAPAASLAGASVRVIGTDGVSTSLQPLVAVHTAASVAGAKGNDESSSLLNGNGVVSTGGTTGFCIPTGVVIPVALSASEAPAAASSSSSSSVAATTSSSFDLQRNAVMSSNLKNLSVNSTTVLSISNGLLKASVSQRGSLQPSTVTGVMTPLPVTRPLVTSMAVVGQPTKHAVAHILTNSSLDKVGPLLKSGSIPFIGGQFSLTSPGRHVIKPVTVMTAPQPSTSPSTVAAAAAVAPRDTTAGAEPSPSSPQSKFPST